MSEQPNVAMRLEFDLADRLRKSLRVADVSVQEMADYLEVNRNTVGRWLGGGGEPKGLYIRMWALRTGVPLEWLTTGDIKQENPSPGGDGFPVSEPPAGIEPATFSLQLLHFELEDVAA